VNHATNKKIRTLNIGGHMGRSLAAACALALAAPMLLLPAPLQANDRTLPMRFALRLEGPAKACTAHCRLFVAASGAITADTSRDFENFAQGRELGGATLALDSDGGSVHGAIRLGREIRALGLNTTVGRLADLDRDGEARIRRASFSGDADCESMCAFVLLGGVHRSVPGRARVMVHQIWLGDRRDDPTAADYSAEDLVLVQRDIGKLAQYTVDMGASIEVLDLALRIPPWEPMHVMTPTEIRDARVATVESVKPATATVAAVPPATVMPPPITDGRRESVISERRWAMVDHAGSVALARSHPLTFEGADIGSFDLMISCGGGSESYDVRYNEHRYGERKRALAALRTVTVNVGNDSVTLKVVSSQRRSDSDELVSFAAGTVPAALIDAFAAAGNHSITVETESAGLVTGIRIGNTGAQQNLPQLAASCRKALGDRAELVLPRTGGIVAAK
jgi:hypothetical protein